MTDQNKHVVFLKGKKVVLRPPRKNSDLESCLRWVNDPEVNQYLTMYLPTSEKKEEEWFERLNSEPNEIVLAIETLEGELIGMIGLHRISWKDGVATTGTMIGEKEYWGRGFGTDAKMVLLNYAFNTLNLRKICSSVIAFNQRSLNYSLGCGYKVEGTRKRQIFKNGGYHDEILLAVFREDWLSLWEEYQKSGESAGSQG